ncbi:MAG TPA: hypothetical protein VN700_15980 [Vicinamibacterales bacterium]|nr:hypothetical protein [Vicinamibacterales bacterium]
MALQRTPFWREGWSLYRELQLWDRSFPRTVFSLNYHVGRWTPRQAVDFLVDRVGHERANAEGEVRKTSWRFYDATGR